MDKRRVQWIDVAKFFGIFAIYLGHFSDAAGLSYQFVFTHHVALFFLISGCTETFNQETHLGKYIIKKIKNVLLPFFFFSFLSIIIRIISTDASLGEIKQMLILVAKGAIRNTFFAGSLWFLTCLFVIEIVFMVIRQFKNNYMIFVLCLFIYILKLKIPGQPSEPYGIYNIDSACRFLIYYAIGFLAFPVIHKLFSLHTQKSKKIITISATISFIYSILLFEKIDLLIGITTIPIIDIFHQIFTALLVIWLYFVVAYLFENVSFFQDLGQTTLYLCGNEYIVKTLVSYFIRIVGLSINITNPLSAYLYTLTLLIIVYKFLIPIEEKMLHKLQALSIGN
jgi:fucose 4-O-acetylase-like acetyltransferase